MPFSIAIDLDKCTGCGLCAKDCVSGVILWEDGRPIPQNPQWCNRCGHCRAICPAEAVMHEGLRGHPPHPVERWKLDPECAREIIMSRRSVRWYKPEPAAEEDIAEIIAVAGYSPTASNTMDVGYIVVTDRELIKRTSAGIFGLGVKIKKMTEKPLGKALFRVASVLLGQAAMASYLDRFDLYKGWTDNGRDMILHNAPAVIIIHGPEKGRFARENCAIAAASLTHYAHARGFGTCYIGFLVVAMERSKKLAARLGVPKGRKGHLALTFGRPSVKYQHTAVRPEAPISWVRESKGR